MRKLLLAFGFLLLPVAAWAQAPTDSTQITVRHVTLTGAGPISQADLRSIANDIEKQKYTGSSIAEISDRIRYGLQVRGFFMASAAAPKITVVSNGPGREMIDLAYDVHEGSRYRLKEITFANVQPMKNLAFAKSELRQKFPISDGAIFDVEKIRAGLEQLRKLYANEGYINFTPVPNTQADDAAGTVALRVDVDEGVVFRLGNLVLDGVEPVPGAGAKLQDAWKQYQGQVYSEPLMRDFIRENAAYLPPHKADWQLLEIRQDVPLHLVTIRLELDDPAAEK
jgi:outer membrane protein assembly factor BamA